MPSPSGSDRSDSDRSSYESYFENAPIGQFVLDQTGEFVDVNQKVCQLLGYSRSQLLTHSLADFVIEWKADGADKQPSFERVDEAGTGSGEVRIRHNDGHAVEVDVEIVELPNGYFLASCQDVTAPNRAERELHEQRRKYTTLVEQSHDGIVIISDKQIVFANREMEQLTGQPIRELVGTSFEQYIAPDQRREVLSIYDARVREEDVVPQYDTELVTAEGERRTVSVKATLIEYRGESALLATLRDVTERKHVEERFRNQNEKLRLFNEVIRHDIRNDMNIVLGYARLVRDQIDDDDAASHLDTVIDRSEHTVELTEIIRDLSEVMLESSDRKQRVDLVEFLGEAIKTTTNGTSLSVSAQLPAPPLSVVADESLGIVFNNLLQNVATHTNSPEPVAEVSIEETKEHVIVRVADNGPGIPDEAKERLFGRGEKGPDSPGTGIGLYLVDSLVRSYGGEVWIVDNPPTGAVFAVQFNRPEQ